MRKIYTSIELGSFSIKIVVCEMIGNNPHVLASSNTRCKGISHGLITDFEMVKEYLNQGITNVEGMLGFKITEAIVGINVKEKSFDILTGEIKIDEENHMIDEKDIEKLYQEITTGKIKENEDLLTIMPISFEVNGELTKNPKGMVGEKLSLKAVIIKALKEDIKLYRKLFKEAGIKIVDMTLSTLGDYYTVRNNSFDNSVSAIINIGYDKIDVSIYNKGIMIKSSSIDEGSKLVDKDLAYMYKIKRGQAKKLKETFAVSNTRYADVNDLIEIVDKDGEKKVLNQLQVSEIVEARISYLLKLAKKEINVLTKREISNIIITGGISELAGFSYVVENNFDHRTVVLDIKNMGIRNNMYSTTLGLIKYFYYKLDFRGITYSMVKEEDSEKLIEVNNKNTASKDNIINKVFGYFSFE